MFNFIKHSLIIALCTIALSSSAQSNEGTAFWCTFMPHVDALINQKVVMVTSKYNTEGKIEAAGVGFLKTFSVIANTVTIIKIPETVELIYSEKVTEQGLLITTNSPSSVYIHQYSNFRSEATLVLPIDALGTEYYTMAYLGKFSKNQVYPSQFVMIATQDNTKIDFTPSSNTNNNLSAGQTNSIVLNTGETYMVQASRETEDISASYISANKPIAVFSGNPWTGVPDECGNWDNLLEQMVPVTAWGKEFITAPSAFTNYDLFRIMASENGTVVNINGAKNNIAKGKFIEYTSSAASYIKSNKPIMVAQFLIGGKCNGHDTGDPSMLILNSIEQNRDSVVLYNSQFQQITENYINLIVKTEDIDITTIDNAPIKNIAVKQEEVINTPYSYLSLKVNDGSHLIITKGCGVIASAYGYGFAESYAYGGGANFRSINAAPIIDGACLNDTVRFDAKLDSFKYDLKWFFGDGDSSSLHKPSHIYNKIGQYNVVLIIENLCLNKKDTITKLIDISLRRDLIGPVDSLVCERDSFTLTAQDANQAASYLWKLPNGKTSKQKSLKIIDASAENAGKYSVVGILSGCATFPIVADITVQNLPFISLGKDTIYCDEDPPFNINIPDFPFILWNNGSSSSSITITQGDSISVVVKDDKGCTNTDDRVIIDFCPTSIYMPNAFSPNGDGINDVFTVSGKNITVYTIDVFDRWGNNVYNGNAWDGTFNGKNISTGVYTYIVNYDAAQKDGSYVKSKVSGDVLVVR